jgi:diguanylate cyclase (GGDEF)-like protein/PAS domain S-box-containing protein
MVSESQPLAAPAPSFAPPALAHSRYVLGLGFAAMLALMVFLTAVGVAQLEASQLRLEGIVVSNLAKITLANRMYVAARERTVGLQRLTLLRDPFERDEVWMAYLAQANEFSEARSALLAMSLTAVEQGLLERQGRLTGVAVPIQDRVMALIWEGRANQAQRLLVSAAIPAQDRVLEQLKALYRLQEQQAATAAAQATGEYRRTRLWLLSLAAVTLALALGIAAAVLRRVRHADAALREEKERAQVTLYSLGEAVIRTDAAGAIEYLNPAAARLSGWTEAEARGRRLADVCRLIHDSSHRPAEDPVAAALTTGRIVNDADDTVLVTRHGEEHAVELTAAPLRDAHGHATGAVLMLRDVTEVRALAREITYQATHDAMTGLLNRREFERLLQQALDGARRGAAEHALCYLDLDLFKAVNDTCGHLAGDELLRQISQRLRKSVRKEDVLARVGGDEFAVLLRDCTLEKAGEIAEQVRHDLKDFHFVWEDKHLDVGASLGVVRVAADSGDLNDVFRAADVACRVAKEDGGNRLHLFRANDLTVTRRQREINWVQRINQAIGENLFVLYGQWVRPLARGAGRASHCEVLIRLRDEHGQIVLPAAFLPAAERYNLMPAIDRWVVRATLAALSRVSPQAAPGLGRVNINLSGQSLCDPEFLAFVLRELETSGVVPGQICFEITETAAVTNLSSAVRLMARLKETGCYFALDDFGSGVSSFSYLKNMPVDYLKIDGAFVSNLPDDRIDLAMVSSVNQVAHIMGIETIAEFVESEAIRATLESLGVDYGQGYALARPQPLADILRDVETAPARTQAGA